MKGVVRVTVVLSWEQETGSSVPIQGDIVKEIGRVEAVGVEEVI